MESGDFEPQTLIDLLSEAAGAIRSVTASPTDEVRKIHAAVNALQAHEADLLALIDETQAHEAEGAASVTTWAVRELLQDPKVTRQLVRGAKTMRDLPSFGHAARAGVLGAAHVNAMSYSLKQVGHDETVTLEPEFVAAAKQHPPRELFNLARYAKAIIHSDELDEAWLNGMEKEFIQCTKVLDGYHLRGFLGIDLGAKLKVFLDAAAVPRDGDDARTAAARHIDGLDDLLTQALNNKLKNTNTVSAHLNVIVDAETLKNTLNGQANNTSQGELLDREPVILEGFGPIGPALLTYIAFGGNLTTILVEGFKANRNVLDVGRQRRLATKAQRRAIHLRQKGRCANRGCHHPIGEIHHIIDWLYGGKTNLSNLAGLCRKCHALISMGRLQMTGTYDTGYTFTTSRTGPLARTG